MEFKDVNEEVIEQVNEEAEQSEKTFTQSELDAIVEKRIARVKAEKPEDYEDLREIAADLEEYGFVGTVAEKKAAIKAAKERSKAEKELEELENEAEITGHSPEILKELKESKKKLKDAEAKLKAVNDVEESKRKELEKKAEDDENWNRQFAEFEEKHSDIDTVELTKDAKFIKYASKHKGELTEIYEDYMELMEETSQSISEKFKRSESRSTGGGKNIPASGSTKLSGDQQKSLEDWNKRYPHMKMTPAEFNRR